MVSKLLKNVNRRVCNTILNIDVPQIDEKDRNNRGARCTSNMELLVRHMEDGDNMLFANAPVSL